MVHVEALLADPYRRGFDPEIATASVVGVVGSEVAVSQGRPDGCS